MEENALIKNIKQNLTSFKIANKKQYINLLKWINNLTVYALQEPEYKNKKVKFWSYARGSIVKVDFGFNVGYELGGVHYAIVMNNNDSIYSGTLNVIPLTSKKIQQKVYPNDIDLGDEFYQHVEHKFDATIRTLNIYNLYHENTKKEIEDIRLHFNNEEFMIDEEFTTRYWNTFTHLTIKPGNLATYEKLCEMLNEKERFYLKEVASYQHLYKELQYMKSGSIAKVSQFTTISKQRIVNPKKKYHALNSIKLFDETIDKINEQMKSMFIFDKK